MASIISVLHLDGLGVLPTSNARKAIGCKLWYSQMIDLCSPVTRMTGIRHAPVMLKRTVTKNVDTTVPRPYNQDAR